MSSVETKSDPSPRELLRFGAALGVSFAVVGSVAQWRFGAPQVAAGVWLIGAAVTVAYFAVSAVRKPVYQGWSWAAMAVGWTVSLAVLALTYYLVLTPIALVMRMTGYDPLPRKWNQSATTYWTPRKPREDSDGYFRQF